MLSKVAKTRRGPGEVPLARIEAFYVDPRPKKRTELTINLVENVARTGEGDRALASLFSHFEAHARRKRIGTLWVEAKPVAADFFRKMGFAPVRNQAPRGKLAVVPMLKKIGP